MRQKNRKVKLIPNGNPKVLRRVWRMFKKFTICEPFYLLPLCLSHRGSKRPSFNLLLILIRSDTFSGDLVRCMGQLIGQTGQFKIVKIGRIDLDDEKALIKRLEAICSFELTKSPTKKKMWIHADGGVTFSGAVIRNTDENRRFLHHLSRRWMPN